jgi:hypothetical protein
VNEQPPENQENQEDGGGEMQIANVASVAKLALVAKRRIRSIQEEHRKFQEKWTGKYFFLYCMMGLDHFVLFA